MPQRSLRRPLRLLAVTLCSVFLLPFTAAAQSPEFIIGLEPIAVVGQPDLSTFDEALTAQGLTEPEAVVIDTVRRKMYVADTGNHRVLRFDLDEAYDSNPTAEAVFGQPDMTSADDPSPLASTMNEPKGLAISSGDHLYVADWGNNRILRFDNASTAASGVDASAVLGQSGFTVQVFATDQSTTRNVVALVIGPGGELWAFDNRRILRWDNPSTLSNGAPADAVLGQANFTADAYGPDQTTLKGVVDGIAIDGNGTLFVADSQANRILRFDDAANKADGAPADAVLGQTDFTSEGSSLSVTGLSRPGGMVIDSTGRLYVSDQNNRRVVWFDNAASLADGAPADGVIGADDFDSYAADDAANALNRPYGIALDGDDKLWVAIDGRNNVVLFEKRLPEDDDDDSGGGSGGGGGEEPAAPAQCEQLPDIALSPERIELTAGGRTTITITMRNLCADAPFSQADLLLSLSDGLSAVDLPAGWLNIGQRAALQGLSLGLGETRSWTLTVAAADALPTAPLHVLELYYRGAAAARIDGVFVPAAAVVEVPAAVEVPVAVEAPAVESAPVAALPAVLPNTSGPLLPLGALALSGLALAAAGAIGRRLG